MAQNLKSSAQSLSQHGAAAIREIQTIYSSSKVDSGISLKEGLMPQLN